MTDELRKAAEQALAYMKSVGEMDMYPEDWTVAMRLEAALAAAPQWIACEERMPEAGVEVLVWLAAPVIKYGCQIAIDTWDEQHETPVAWSSATIPIGEGWDSGADWQDITHWMPLPAAPESEE